MDNDLVTIFFGVSLIILASGFVKYIMPVIALKATRRHQLLSLGMERDDAAQLKAKALETYERLAREKLDVIKTALAMGYSDKELADLDARLEKLVGKEKLDAILMGASPEAIASADLIDTQLEREAQRLRAMRENGPK